MNFMGKSERGVYFALTFSRYDRSQLKECEFLSEQIDPLHGSSMKLLTASVK